MNSHTVEFPTTTTTAYLLNLLVGAMNTVSVSSLSQESYMDMNKE